MLYTKDFDVNVVACTMKTEEIC